MVLERCTGCGAKAPEGAEVCAYCGETIAVAEAPVAAPAVSSRLAQFDALADHPSFAKWMEWRPAPEAESSEPRYSLLEGAFVVIVAVMIVLSISGGPIVSIYGPRIVLPLALAGLLGFVLFAWWRKPSTRAAPPAKPYPAIVVAKRAETTERSTRYFATLEFRTGRRREYPVDGEFFGLLADGDAGVAYVAEDDLVTFKTLSV